VLRAAEVQTLAAALDLPPETTLADLAAAAPEPWGLLFGEHRDALRALVAEVETATRENRRLLHADTGADPGPTDVLDTR
jgi:hypothetical protein